MRVIADFSEFPPFDIDHPTAQSKAFVFNSPHSGHTYPRAFLEGSRLDSGRIRQSEDAHVDRLYAHVTAAGAPLLRAHFPRAYVDVNREPYELDPNMFVGRLPPHANIRSPRVAGGLGTVPRVVSEHEPIYAGAIPVEDALARIETLYKPYHGALRRMIAQTHVKFGYAVLIDCHSMPSTIRGLEMRSRPDFVLGDRHGTAASPALMDFVANALTGLGYRVAINKPYAGGFITEHYGRPAKGLHALQIEVNRALYMNEKTLEPHDGFEVVRRDLGLFTDRLFALPKSVLGPITERFAAE